MYNPYAKGRWYRLFVESDGTAYTITESDLEVEISGQYVKMPENFHVLDTVYDIDAVTGGTAADMNKVIRIYNDGRQAISLPASALFDYTYVYVFGYIK